MTHLWTTAEVARFHNVSPESVRRWVREKRLKPAVITPTQALFDIQEARAFVRPTWGRPAPVKNYDDELTKMPDPPWAKKALAILAEGETTASTIAKAVKVPLHTVHAWLELSEQAGQHVELVSELRATESRYRLRESHE